MFSLALSLIALSPVVQANDAGDEFSFIEEGEKNRALNEADRAPDASLFLEEEDEDQAWSSAPTPSTSSIDSNEAIDGALGQLSFERSDPEEDTGEFGPDMTGLAPLGDHFPITIDRSPLGIIVAELPVLVARNQGDIGGDLWIVADIYSDGVKVSESRHFVSQNSVSEVDPSYVWIKTSIPTQAPAGQVEMRVFAAPPGKKEVQIFARKTSYRL